MGALTYHFFKRTKNQIKLFLRSPAKIIYAVILIFAFSSSFTARNLPVYTELRDINELYAIVWAIYTFVFVTVSKNGFNNGSALFSMADVNLVFTSPVKNTSSLIYAMLQQLGRSFFLGIVLMLQFNTVNDYYGVGYLQFLLMVLFYCLTVFFAQMLSVMIYTLCSGNNKKASMVKAIYYLVVAVFAAFGVFGSFSEGSFSVKSIVNCLNGEMFGFFPVSGFFIMILKGIMADSLKEILLGTALLAAFVILFILIVFVKKFDFYEDVITSAQINSNMGGSSTDVPEARVPKKIKTGKTGITKGFGANVIYEKNKIENRREKFLYVDASTIIYAVICCVISFVADSIWSVFIVMVYLTMFGVSTGRYVRELNLHYIFLIPEKSSKKLFNMLKEQLPMYIVQSFVVILPVMFILRLNVIEFLSIVLARFSFCLLFTGVTVLMKNLFSSSNKSIFYGFMYMLFSFLASIPSVIAAVAMSMIFIFNFEFAFVSIFIVNTLVAALLIAANKNILEK